MAEAQPGVALLPGILSKGTWGCWYELGAIFQLASFAQWAIPSAWRQHINPFVQNVQRASASPIQIQSHLDKAANPYKHILLKPDLLQVILGDSMFLYSR